MTAKKKTAKPYNWDTKIIAAIRKVWRYSPERRAVIEAARSTVDHKMVWCAGCQAWVHEKLAAVDHVKPIVPITGFDSWDAYIFRMRTYPMQILCEPCHKAKTKFENSERAAFRKLNKVKKK